MTLERQTDIAKALLKQGKINDAHLILSELLIYDPQNKYVKKTIKKIETNENFSKTNVNSDLNNMINKIVNFYQNNQIENAIVEVEKAYSEHPNSSMINNLKGLISKNQDTKMHDISKTITLEDLTNPNKK